MKAAGLKNVVWRTPGADGGRDIEGYSFVRDISGHDLVQKWHIECKLYSSSINWPTVWEKIAHADALDADVLLIVTNNNPSPTCETRIKEWNDGRRTPVVRFWRGYDLPAFLTIHQRIAVMYGLSDGDQQINAAVLPLSLVIAKISQAAYVANELGGNLDTSLEAASSLSELLSTRLTGLKNHGSLKPIDSNDDLLDFGWVEQHGSCLGWEMVGLRATLAFARYITAATNARLEINANRAEAALHGHRFPLLGSGGHDLDMIAGWCGFQASYLENSASLVIERQY